LPAFSISNLSAVNRFRSTTSLRFGFPATPFRRTPNFTFKTHAKRKNKTSTFEPKPNKVEELIIEEEEEEEEEEEIVLPEEIQENQDGVFWFPFCLFECNLIILCSLSLNSTTFLVMFGSTELLLDDEYDEDDDDDFEFDESEEELYVSLLMLNNLNLRDLER